MAYREHQGWTPANHLVELRAQQAYREHEAAHQAAGRGTLTTARAPLNDGHLRRNAKREIAREVEHAQVEHANLLLLAKLHRTVNRPSSAGPSGVGAERKGQRSMNLRNRRAEFQRIERENQVRALGGGGVGGGCRGDGAMRSRAQG